MILLTSLLLAATTVASSPQTVPVSQSDLTGTWRSEGYGFLVDVSPSAKTLYHEAAGICLADTNAEAQSELFSSAQVINKDQILLSPEPGLTGYFFDRIPALPSTCLETGRLTPEERFLFATETLKAWYPARPNSNPAQIVDKVRRSYPDISSEPAAWQALTDVFVGLGDPHSEVHGMIGGEAVNASAGEAPTLHSLGPRPAWKSWFMAYRTAILDNLLNGKGHLAGNGRILWGRIGDIGYINFVSMGAFDPNAAPDDTSALDKILDDAMTEFQEAKAVIVDVGINGGGYDSVSLKIAARFAEKKVLAYTKQPAGSPTTPQQPVYLVPSARPCFTGQVIVVTSDITVSAGEVFVLTMRALPNVIQVGTATRGALSDQIEKPLGRNDDWSFGLSAEIYLDPTGFWAEGKGYPPDYTLEQFSIASDQEGHAKAIRHLFEMILKKDPALNLTARGKTGVVH